MKEMSELEARAISAEEALEKVRQELWVDYCLHMGRTDCDPGPFNSRPMIRIIDEVIHGTRTVGHKG